MTETFVTQFWMVDQRANHQQHEQWRWKTRHQNNWCCNRNDIQTV